MLETMSSFVLTMLKMSVLWRRSDFPASMRKSVIGKATMAASACVHWVSLITSTDAA